MVSPDELISNELRNVSEIYRVQILLAYFLSRIDQPCTPAQLAEIATGEGIVNYFDYSAAITAMLENNTVQLTEIDGTEYYTLTERGLKGADNFKRQVSKSIRDRIYAAGLRLFTKLKNERDVTFEITPDGTGFQVRCRCMDGKRSLMDLTLYAPDEEQANFIKSKIQMDPTAFYCNVIDHVIENEEYVPSIEPEDSEEPI